MAASTIANIKLERNSFGAYPTAAVVTANDGLVVEFTEADQKILIIAENTDTITHTIVVKGGNGFMCANDIEHDIATAGKAVIVLESGGYKNVSGDNAGKVLIQNKDTQATALSVACIVLP